MKRILLPLCAIMLVSCSQTPKAINIENGNERSLSCDQLSYELQVAQQSKVDAHKDDHFKITNMFAYWWLYHMQKADSNATARIELLTKIAQTKGCFNPGQMPQ